MTPKVKNEGRKGGKAGIGNGPPGNSDPFGWARAVRNVSGTEPDLSPLLSFISQAVAWWTGRWKGLSSFSGASLSLWEEIE